MLIIIIGMGIEDYYSEALSNCQAPLTWNGVLALVITSTILGILWAVRNLRLLTTINLHENSDIEL